MKITLRTVLCWIATALVIAAFIVSFGAGIKGNPLNILTEYKGLAFGKQTTVTIIGGSVIENETVKPVDSLISKIAVILILVGGVFAGLVGTFKTKFNKKGLLIFAALIIVVGAVMMLFTKEGWIDSQIKEMFKDSSASQSTIDKAKESMTKTYEDFINNDGTIFTSVLGFAAAALTGLSATLKEKKGK